MYIVGLVGASIMIRRKILKVSFLSIETWLIEEKVWKLIRITMQVTYIFVLVYAKMRTFLVTRLLYSCLTNQ